MKAIISSPVNTQKCLASVSLELGPKALAGRLFTYIVPDYLKEYLFVGSHVLVPFGGTDLVSGFVVGLETRLEDTELSFKTKEIHAVLDEDPLFDASYVDYLYFIADYYMCSLSEVIQAAVPAELGGRTKKLVKAATTYLEGNLPVPEAAESKQILSALAGFSSATVSSKALAQRAKLKPASFYLHLSKLKKGGYLELIDEDGLEQGAKTFLEVRQLKESSSSKRQQEILSILAGNDGVMPLSELLRAAETTSATIKKMAGDALVKVAKVETYRDPLKDLSSKLSMKTLSPPELTKEQGAALQILRSALEVELKASPEAEKKPYLLWGVTGSGKTEIYLRLIEACLAEGRTALLMVPEISLTPQLAQRLLGRFGSKVALWHSGLSAGERFDTWRRLQSGDLKVVLGARSAVLLKIPDLGLIVLDEEHDSSYKQSSPNPRYQTRVLALERARRAAAMVLLGSATPDTGSFVEAKKNNRLLKLESRVFGQALPESVLVDMRDEFKEGNKSIFSDLLLRELDACLSRKEQAILLLNRRGYASHVFCRSCGYVVTCKNCSVSLVFHGKRADKGALVCHHCGFQKPMSSTCPSCQSPFLKHFGLGTQRVEEDLREIFADTRIVRLDSDTTARKGSYQEIFSTFQNGQADVLIGTQMVAKGLDFERVTLVGVLAADAAFNLPDFRSLERGFQLLTQVSGRAGRGSQPGKVILQTFNTELSAINLARRQDYAAFAEEELASRKDFQYPPYSQLIRLVLSGEDETCVQAASERLAEELSHYLDDKVAPESLPILGPAPCLIERLRGKFRYHLLLKNSAGELGRKALSEFFARRAKPKEVSLAIDVDAIDLI